MLLLWLDTLCLQWVELKDADVDIGANPSAEEAEEGTDSSSRKVVDVVDAFNLSVRAAAAMHGAPAVVAAAEGPRV